MKIGCCRKLEVSKSNYCSEIFQNFNKWKPLIRCNQVRCTISYSECSFQLVDHTVPIQEPRQHVPICRIVYTLYLRAPTKIFKNEVLVKARLSSKFQRFLLRTLRICTLWALSSRNVIELIELFCPTFRARKICSFFWVQSICFISMLLNDFFELWFQRKSLLSPDRECWEIFGRGWTQLGTSGSFFKFRTMSLICDENASFRIQCTQEKPYLPLPVIPR